MRLNPKERKEAEASYPIFQNRDNGMYGFMRVWCLPNLCACKYDTRLKAIRARNEYYINNLITTKVYDEYLQECVKEA